MVIYVERHSSAMAHVAMGLTTGMELYRVEFACSRCVCVGSLLVFGHPSTVQKHAGESQLETLNRLSCADDWERMFLSSQPL